MLWKIVNESSSEGLTALPDSTVEQHPQNPIQDERNQLWELLPVAPQGGG